MQNGKILRIFSLPVLVAALSGSVRGDVPVTPRVRLTRDVSGGDREFLAAAIRQLDQLRRLSGRKPPRRELVVTGGRKEFAYRAGGLSLPGDAAVWSRDFALRRKIYGALAAHHFELSAPHVPELAPWAAAGLDDAVAGAVTMGRYIAGNRTYPLMAAWWRLTGGPPDFAVLCRLDRPGGAVVDDFAAEQARLLLEIFARNGRIRELFSGLLSGERPDFWLKWYSDAAEARRSLAADAEPLVWNRYCPLPTGTAEEKVAELEVFFFPEADKEGRLTKRTISGNIDVLCAQFSVRRDDRTRTLDALAAPWRKLGRRLASKERELCSAIAECIRAAGAEPGVPAAFKTAVAKLRAELRRRRELERLLTRELDAKTSPVRRLRRPLAAAADDTAAPGAARMEFFLRTLDRYWQ